MKTLDQEIARLAAQYLPLAARLLREAIRIPADYVDRAPEDGGDPLCGQSNHEGPRLEALKAAIVEIGAVRRPEDVGFDAFGNLVWALEDDEDGVPAREKRVIYWDGHCDTVGALREQWVALGLPPERLHTTGQVPPDAVPRALAAMDVGTLPLPWTEHFAYYASPIKLFEYMAAGCVVLASDLPGTAEVVRNGESALLVPPGDAAALAGALRRLIADRDLCERLRAQARRDVEQYAWAARAARIRAFVEGDR